MKQRAFFLDRDGVLNFAAKGPPNSPQELVMIPGVGEAIKILNNLGYRIFVVTNQGGVGLGYFTQRDLDSIHRRLEEEIATKGGQIDEIIACTHKPFFGCSCRKPKPGMLTTLAKKYGIDLTNSYMVGDRDIDIQAGQAAGTKTIFIGQANQAPVGVHIISPSLLSAVTKLFAN